jgi:V8-like Glu-specific endopeptidase
MNIQNLHNIVFSVGRLTPNGVNLLGTCFLLNKENLYATTSHVTANDENNLVIVMSSNTNLNNYQDTSDNRIQYIKAIIKAVDPIRDIAILSVEKGTNYSNIHFNSTDKMNVKDKVSIIGFPHCTMGRQVLTYQETIIGAKILIETSGVKSKNLVLNIQTRPGQSGSPIFNTNDSTLVGMIIGSYVPSTAGGVFINTINPDTLHQTTHAISSDYILEMI